MYDPNFEHRRELLAENRLEAGNYKILDANSRALKRITKDGQRYLVLVNSDGDVILLHELFELGLYHISKKRLEEK
jgi:hypothetical protein